MKTYEEERAELRKRCMAIAEAVCEADDAEDLLYHLLMKRECDGLNGRCWDASEHLAHEAAAARIIYRHDGGFLLPNVKDETRR